MIPACAGTGGGALAFSAPAGTLRRETRLMNSIIYLVGLVVVVLAVLSFLGLR